MVLSGIMAMRKSSEWSAIAHKDEDSSSAPANLVIQAVASLMHNTAQLKPGHGLNKKHRHMVEGMANRAYLQVKSMIKMDAAELRNDDFDAITRIVDQICHFVEERQTRSVITRLRQAQEDDQQLTGFRAELLSCGGPHQLIIHEEMRRFWKYRMGDAHEIRWEDFWFHFLYEQRDIASMYFTGNSSSNAKAHIEKRCKTSGLVTPYDIHCIFRHPKKSIAWHIQEALGVFLDLDWAHRVIRELQDNARERVLSSTIYEEQCLVLCSLIAKIEEYFLLWWNDAVLAASIAEKLLKVLKRSLGLIGLCQEKEQIWHVLSRTGEFSEIVEDVMNYVKMMNRWLARFSPVFNEVRQVEDDLAKLQESLLSAYEKDKATLLRSLKTSSSLPFKDVLICRVEKGLNLEEPTIQDSLVQVESDTVLGWGSFGNVHRAKISGFPVAVKVFKVPEHFDDESRVFRVVEPLNCFHIVHIVGHYQQKSGEKCLVLELMDKDMKQLLKERGGSLNQDESLEIMLQIAKAMRQLHEKEVVYRDLKPSNVLVKHREDSLLVKLADFGVSKSDFHTANDHTFRGTPGYLAPEMKALQACDGGEYSKKVDTFSFGIVFTEILTGSKPIFQGPQGTQAVPIRDIRSSISRLIASCLEEQASKRPTFAAICEELWIIKEEFLA